MMGKVTVSLLLAIVLLATGCGQQTGVPVGEKTTTPTLAPSPTAQEKATQPALTATSVPIPTPSPSDGGTSVKPGPTAAKPAPTTVAAKPKGRTVLGYYVTYDPTSWASLQANARDLDYVALQTIGPDPCGNIAPETDLTLLEFARSRGVRVLPSVFTSSKWLNHRLLADEATTANFVRQLTAYVVEDGYDGLDVDIEDVEPDDRKQLTALIKRLSESMRKQGKLLAMAVPAKASDVTTGWAGAYDYAALANHVDLFTIMSYAYTTSGSPPGSTAPISWVDRVTAFATSQIAAEKVLLGVPFYGYDWNVTAGGSARALRYPQAAALAAKYAASIATDPASASARFTYTARAGDQPPADEKLPPLDHKVKTRAKPPCAVQSATPVPRPTQPAKPTPVPAVIQEHVVWLEDAPSLKARLDLAGKHAAGGIGAWRLGQEDPRIWPLLQAWRR